MSQGVKSAQYRAIKDAGIKLDKHYRDYTADELVELAAVNGVAVVDEPSPLPPRDDSMVELQKQMAGLAELVGTLANVVVRQAQQPAPAQPSRYDEPVAAPQPVQGLGEYGGLDPFEHAGLTMNTHGENDPIRTDPDGTIWYRNEVQKPGYAKPRGRSKRRYLDPGVEKQTIRTKDGATETFEVPGDPRGARELEVTVTLPSFQTGIFKPKGMPFKIHTYQGLRAFDWQDVVDFYGAEDLIPDTVKRVYVSGDLCFDITTTIRAIKDEERELRMKGQLR